MNLPFLKLISHFPFPFSSENGAICPLTHTPYSPPPPTSENQITLGLDVSSPLRPEKAVYLEAWDPQALRQQSQR